MNMNKFAAAMLSAGAMLAAGSASAVTYPDFTVDPSAYSPRTLPFVADKLTGNYQEVITFTGTPFAGTFNVSLKFEAGQFVANDGTTPLTARRTGLGNNYGLYALFQGTGTYSSGGPGTVTTFMAAPGGNIDFFLDRFAPETTPITPNPLAPSVLPFLTPGSGDDVQLVMGGKVVSGKGTLDPTLSTCNANAGNNCGSFGQTTTFPLTAAGMAFFVAPKPFYTFAFESGQLNNFDVSQTQNINGSLDIVFGNTVPEPAGMALVGAALVGLCLVKRRKV